VAPAIHQRQHPGQYDQGRTARHWGYRASATAGSNCVWHGLPLYWHCHRGTPHTFCSWNCGDQRELCRQLANTPQLFPVLWGLWVFYFVRGILATARELGEPLLDLAQGAQDPVLLLEATLALGTTLLRHGEMASARSYLEQGIALYNPTQHRSHTFLYGRDPGVAYLSEGAVALWLLGYPDQALERVHEALSLPRELAHPFSIGFALSYTT
jgi:predicted ATPase